MISVGKPQGRRTVRKHGRESENIKMCSRKNTVYERVLDSHGPVAFC
jgi:hypothetical protein